MHAVSTYEGTRRKTWRVLAEAGNREDESVRKRLVVVNASLMMVMMKGIHCQLLEGYIAFMGEEIHCAKCLLPKVTEPREASMVYPMGVPRRAMRRLYVMHTASGKVVGHGPHVWLSDHA